MKRNIRNNNYLLFKTIYMSNLEKNISIPQNNRVDANYILLIGLITCIYLLNFLIYYIAELLFPFVIKKKRIGKKKKNIHHHVSPRNDFF